VKSCTGVPKECQSCPSYLQSRTKMSFSISICNSEASNQRVHEWKPCTIGKEEQFGGDKRAVDNQQRRSHDITTLVC